MCSVLISCISTCSNNFWLWRSSVRGCHFADLNGISSTFRLSLSNEKVFNPLRPLRHSRNSWQQVAVPNHPLNNIIWLDQPHEYLIVITEDVLRSFPLSLQAVEVLQIVPLSIPHETVVVWREVNVLIVLVAFFHQLLERLWPSFAWGCF